MWTMAPVVAAYQTLRGVSFLVAITFVAEVGDVGRFATSQQLMAFLGLVPSERMTGGHRAARLYYEDWHSSRTTGADRGSVELPLFRRDLASSAQGYPPLHPQHRLEGTSPAVRLLPPAHCQWQKDPVAPTAIAATSLPSCGQSVSRLRPRRQPS
jgi:hypothetical protein